MNKTLITICARGGSKGIPNKNIKPLGGKPLISYSIQTAFQFAKQHDAEIALSTDSQIIKDIASEFGLLTDYTRPDSLATDSAGKLPVVADVLRHYESINKTKYNFVLDLDVTSPLRNVDDLNSCQKLLQDKTDAVNIFSVSPANRNPYFNMVEEKENGFYNLIAKGDFVTRQSSPKVYDLNASYYIYRRNFFELNYTSAITPKSIVHEVDHMCFDLDEPIDFEFMEFLINNNKLDFKL